MTKKVTRTHHRNSRRPTTLQSNGEQHAALSDAEDRIGRSTLGVDYLFVSIL
jgi:hypothetical protein